MLLTQIQPNLIIMGKPQLTQLPNYQNYQNAIKVKMTILKLWSWRIWWRRYKPSDLIIWAMDLIISESWKPKRAMVQEPYRDLLTWSSELRLGWWNSLIQGTNSVGLRTSLGTWRRRLTLVSESGSASESISMRSLHLRSTKPYSICSKSSRTSTTTICHL